MDQSAAFVSAKKYAAAVRGLMDTQQVLLYGSHATGTAKADSDIDIAVIVERPPKDYLAALTLLWQATYAVDNMIEPVLLIANDSRGGFLQQIYRTGIAI